MVIRIPASMPGATSFASWRATLGYSRPPMRRRRLRIGLSNVTDNHRGTIGTSPTCDSGLATCDLRRNNSIPGWRLGGGEYCTYCRMDNLFVLGFVSAGLPPVKQSRAGDCSGKSPNMHVAVAVRNMD